MKRMKLPENKKMYSDIFYEKSVNKNFDNNKILHIPQEWIKIHFKTYPRLQKVKLKTPSVMESSRMIINRRSTRRFSKKKLSFKTFSRILYSCAGITSPSSDVNFSRRSYPSAGARYPIETYILTFRVDKLDQGLYHYNVRDNLLEKLHVKNMESDILSCTGGEKWILNSSFLCILTGIPDRSRIKYGERGFRYMLMEAGHLAQNLLLFSNHEKLAGCPLGGFIENKVVELLDIAHVNEYPLYMIVIGKPFKYEQA